MPELEATLKILITAAIFISLILTAGLLFRRLVRKPPVNHDAVDRFAGLEAKIGEIEERLDFTERMLTEVRARVQLPPKP